MWPCYVAAEILKAYRIDARYERIFLFAALEGHELGLAHHRSFALPVLELFSGYVARRQREGALRDHDPGLVIAAVAGMAQTYGIYTELFGFEATHLEDSHVVDVFTDIAMRGIRLSQAAKPTVKTSKKTIFKATRKARNRK